MTPSDEDLKSPRLGKKRGAGEYIIMSYSVLEYRKASYYRARGLTDTYYLKAGALIISHVCICPLILVSSRLRVQSLACQRTFAVEYTPLRPSTTGSV